jgi:hypothetical protein
MNTVAKRNPIQKEKYKAVLSNRIYLTRTKELQDKLIKELTYTLPPTRPGGKPETICDVTKVNNNVITIKNKIIFLRLKLCFNFLK